MDSIIEQQRLLHEEIERIEQAIVRELLDKPRTHKDRVVQMHRVKRLLDRQALKSRSLLTIYEDSDKSRLNELDLLSGISGASTTEMGEFYDRLKGIKDRYRRNPQEGSAAFTQTLEQEYKKRNRELDEMLTEKLFSGEEQFGKFLDLTHCYDLFINLPTQKASGRKLDYVAYLAMLAVQEDEAESSNGSRCGFQTIPRQSKTGQYRAYLTELSQYLLSFLQRAQPLLNTTQLMDEELEEFDKHWAKGSVPGWEKQHIDSELFCVPCGKLFAKQTVFTAHLTGKKHLKAVESMNKTSNGTTLQNGSSLTTTSSNDAKEREMAWLEWQCHAILRVLSRELSSTQEAVERKLTLTHEELSHRFEEQEEAVNFEEKQHQQQQSQQDGDGGSDDEDDERIYNPLKLPLGWDGKPIPFWLYKLHGLGIEYPCEICGNFVYMGRKAFERHFQEWRHAYGMRCLGITNTLQFQEVTKIADALSLWKKIQQDQSKRDFKADEMEEFEDQQGNVFNKKTFEDLRRQGLL